MQFPFSHHLVALTAAEKALQGCQFGIRITAIEFEPEDSLILVGGINFALMGCTKDGKKVRILVGNLVQEGDEVSQLEVSLKILGGPLDLRYRRGSGNTLTDALINAIKAYG